MAADLSALRDRLLALCADVLRQIAEADHVEPGLLALLAGAEAALRLLDGVPPSDAMPADRAVVIDEAERRRPDGRRRSATVAEVTGGRARMDGREKLTSGTARRAQCRELKFLSRRRPPDGATRRDCLAGETIRTARAGKIIGWGGEVSNTPAGGRLPWWHTGGEVAFPDPARETTRWSCDFYSRSPR